jgi:ribA/ribD-fused uncharacterized protein
MVIGLMHKFQQNDGLRAELLATEGAELIEASPFDDRWGAGKTANKILDGERWHGKNLLGELRRDCAKIHSKNQYFLPRPHPDGRSCPFPRGCR